MIVSDNMQKINSEIKSLYSNVFFNSQLALKLREFKAYIESFSDGLTFTSFENDSFIDSQENYKKRIGKISRGKK